jgi:glycogen debranching enzyme
MGETIGSSVAGGPAEANGALTRDALAVLDANWDGGSTRPSPRLYPHQWSWDSACIAIGRSRFDQDRAERELRSLFAAQWANGLLPHIVFSDGDGQYFPGPEFWQAHRSPDAPAGLNTSGIVQPPIHATAALRVYRHARDRSQAARFLDDLMPGLAAWHAYLYRHRVRGDDGLAEIWHPWESGMDNSPLWDDALARIVLTAEQVPDYQRIDVQLAEASERPSDDEYDRYAYLVGLFRSHDYRADEIRAACPFALQPVLFNALLAQAGRDLAEIARIVGERPEPFDEAAEWTSAGLDSLWDEEHAVYADHDLTTGRPVPVRTAAGLSPMHAGVPNAERAARIVARLADSRIDLGDGLWAVSSLAPGDPGFQPTRYWRGPVWPILNWVLHSGLVRYGYRELAEPLRRGLIGLCRRSGFWEHYSPVTGRGHGGEQFAWTAALVLDLMHEGLEEGERMTTTDSPSTTEGRS